MARERQMLSPKEAVAEGYLVSLDQAARLRMRGDGPAYYKLGDGKNSPIRYRRADLERWLESHRVRTVMDLPAGQRLRRVR